MPDFKTIVREHVAALHLEAAAENNLVEELAQHLEDRYRELAAAGVAEAEALRRAASELDDLHPLQAAPLPRAPRGNFLADLFGDLRYAGRGMRRSPLFVISVVLTLALGIGANTTVFTVINTLILNPLPVEKPATLVALSTRAQAKNTSKSAILPVSYLNLKNFAAQNQVFRSLAGYSSPRILTRSESGAAPERLFTEFVTADYFPTLGLRPARGRFFLGEEDSNLGAHPVAVMNYSTWQTRFGGAPDTIGRTLRLNQLAVTVIGIAPPDFIGVNGVFGPDLWIPAAMSELLFPNQLTGVLTDRGKPVFQGVGRLKAGVNRRQAQADIETIAAALARTYPSANENRTAVVTPISDALFGNAGMGRTPVVFAGIVLSAVVAIILLIACSNVANLLLARSAGRRQEIALRLAMGASRARLVRQLLTESVALAFLAGLAGIGIGYVGLQFLWSARWENTNLIAPKLDALVLIFSLVLSVLTGLIFGMLPALRATRTDLAETLKEETRSGGRSRSRVTIANALLVTQVAFSFVSLMTAGLFLRSIRHAYQIDPGFEPRHLAVIMTSPGQAGYDQSRTMAFYRASRDRVAHLPGVESASWASGTPLWARTVSGIEVEGRTPRSRDDSVVAVLFTIDSGYFKTAGVALDRGRDFTDADQAGSAPVAIVNEKLAQDYWPGVDPLGKRVQLPGESSARQVVGIARTANYTSLGEPPQPCIYVPLQQHYFDAMVLYVRAHGDPGPLLNPASRELRAAGPQVDVSYPRTGSTIIDNGLYSARIGVSLLSVFGFVALALAAVGLYGLLAYSVNTRQREIGVRMALGAAQSGVLRLILKEGMTLVVAGVGIGLLASLATARLLARMLYGVSPFDPLSVATSAAVLLAVALVACYLPARSASRLDPLTALRQG